MNAIIRFLFDWVFVLLFRMLQAFLQLVNFCEQIFDVFAGTAKVSYNGQKDYLINVFFGQSSVSVVFWGVTAIAMTLCFAFTIIAVTRKTLDIGGVVKNSIGQIVTNAAKAGITFLLLSFLSIASVNLATVVLVQVNYLMKNANNLLYEDPGTRTFTGEEYSAMTRIMNTIANYSLVPSMDSRFNINTCFNAIRGDLQYLYLNGFFDTYYGSNQDASNWQSALALIAGAGDIDHPLPLDEVNSSITAALVKVMNQLKNNPNFKPLESVAQAPIESMSMDNTIFLTATLTAPYSSIYRNNPSFTDALRRSYSNGGSKSYNNLTQVRGDFDIWNVRYDVGYIACIVFVVVMVKCIFTFILRLFDLLLLYISAPFFVSSMPLDDGQKFQVWRQAFIVKLISGFGSVMAMRLYLMLIPLVMGGKLVFFDNPATNYMAQLLFILAGAYAVMKATSLLTNIVAGTPGAAARGEEMGAMLGGMVLGKTVNTATSIVKRVGGSTVGAIRRGISFPASPAQADTSAREHSQTLPESSRAHGTAASPTVTEEQRKPSVLPESQRGAVSPPTGSGGLKKPPIPPSSRDE